jgi:hypothetical protein
MLRMMGFKNRMVRMRYSRFFAAPNRSDNFVARVVM